MIMELENKQEAPEEIVNKKILDLYERFDAKEDFKLDKVNMSLDDYVNYVKDNPSKTIAVMDPKTGYPKFVLKYDNGYIKLYGNENTISKFYDYRGKPEDKEIPKEYYGKFIPGKVDEIRSQRPDMDINLERLSKDVLYIMNPECDDDDDPDKGGQKILRKKSKGKDDDDKGKKLEEEEKIHIPFSGKPEKDNNDDDDDNDKGMNIEQPTRKTSDEYRLEMTLLESEKDKLMKEVEKYKSEIPKLEDINNKLADKLEKMQEEIEFLKGVEKSTEKDYQELRRMYDEQVEDAKKMGLSNRELNEELKKIDENYERDTEAMSLSYHDVKAELKRNLKN